PGWSGEVIGLLRNWLATAKRAAGQERSLTGALLAFAGEARVQRLVADTLADPKTALATRLLLLRVVARCRVDPLPKPWMDARERALGDEDLTVCREAVSAIKARNLSGFDQRLAALSRQADLAAELRIAALDCIAGRQQQLAPEAFALLTSHLSEKTDPLLRVAAARALGSATLNGKQLAELAKHLTEAGPLVVPLLTPAFTRSRDPAAGQARVGALKRPPGAEALSADDLERLFKGYPVEVQTAAHPLRERLAARQKGQAAYLAALTQQLLQTQANAERGKEVFFS